MGSFENILKIARDNVQHNPELAKLDAPSAIAQYLRGLTDEVAEVQKEARSDNRIYLSDELSDIAWDYAVLLALCERFGYIENVEAVLRHGAGKYIERSEAFLAGNQDAWNRIKKEQKVALAKEHYKLYGN